MAAVAAKAKRTQAAMWRSKTAGSTYTGTKIPANEGLLQVFGDWHRSIIWKRLHCWAGYWGQPRPRDHHEHASVEGYDAY